MKKQVIITISVVVAVVLIAGGVVAFMKPSKTNLSPAEKGQAVFEYEDTKISEMLSAEDLSAIREMFDGKELYKDNPSCGFSETIAVVLDASQVFCVARDECPVIYYKNEGQYFSLSDQENEQLRNILENYGFRFPCV